MDKTEKLLKKTEGYTVATLYRKGAGKYVHASTHCIEIICPSYPAGLFLHYNDFDEAKAVFDKLSTA